MSFGVIRGTWLPRKKRPEKAEPEKKQPEPFVPAESPQEVTVPETKQKKEPERRAPAPVPPTPQYAADLQILCVGRTVGQMLEFFCSMKENLTEMLTGEQLSIYIRELKTMTDLSTKQKRMGEFFFRFSQDSWTWPADGPAEEVYQFSISPAGRQSGALHISLRMVTPASGGAQSWQAADAVWLFADGALYDTTVTDSYTAYLQQLLREMDAGQLQRPVALLLTQIEGIGHYQTRGGRQALPAKEKRVLLDRARAVFGGLHPAALIPVQVYGGLEYTGLNAAGMPQLHLSSSGYFQMYVPAGCELPFLWSMQQILTTRQLLLFPDTVSGGFVDAVGRYYDRKIGLKGWKPEVLTDEVKS